MATPTATRPGRSLAVLAVLTALVFGLIWAVAPAKLGKDTLTLANKYTPRLGLDLEGGTSVILTPRVAPGNKGKITKDNLDQAVQIIRSRVDSFGVAEAEVTTAGDHIVISIPGTRDQDILETVRQTAELRFRPVLLSGPGNPTPTQPPSPAPSGSPSPAPSGSPSGSPSSTGSSPAPSPSPTTNGRAVTKGLRAATSPGPTSTPSPSSSPSPSAPADPTAAITPALQKQFAELDCRKLRQVREQLRASGDDPAKPIVTCRQDGLEKYILGPAELLGTDVNGASAALERNNQGQAIGGRWEVDLSFTGAGGRKFGEITRRMAGQTGDLNRFGIVLDGLVVSAPGTDEPILNGKARITGDFTQDEARNLANVLKYGALPLTFDPGEVQEVSATLGGDQLHAGLIAGVIGLLLVVLYSLLYYRGLGLVTVASLAVASVLTFGTVVLLGWYMGFRLSLAGIAGMIVAIGITADSFVVFFERLRDEVRDGRTLRVAVETGWVRARRTILAADFVSFLAAVVLYILSVGGVRGFAFTLGLTTLIDIVVVFLFTKPLVTVLARTKFYGQGHRLSGLDPRHLGVQQMPQTTATARRRAAALAKES